MREPGTPIRVAHVITGLLVGGAEMQLTRLLSTMSLGEFPALVVTLMPDGPLSQQVRDLGVPVIPLGLKRGGFSVGALIRLRRELRSFRPDLLQGWMYHGNLATSVAAIRLNAPVLWHVLQTLYDPQLEPLRTRLTIRAGARLSTRVAGIVYNSQISRAHHERAGFQPALTEVIPNGFDTGHFRPSATAAQALRAELSVPAERPIVGLVNRYHPMKGHETFLRAARMMLDAGADATFVCAGREVVPTNPTLMGLVGELGLGDRVHLLGERDDTARLFAAFDVTCCSSSWGEGFPNVIGESMACGTPCVVTDVGDAPAAVGQTGVVVPPRNPEALGQAILQLLSLAPDLRRDLGDAARRRVQTEFPLPRYGERFAALYRQILSGRRVEYGPRRARTSVPSEAARSTTPSSPGGDR